MKPANFPGRRDRRMKRAMRRQGVTVKWIEQPTDIRMRIGAARREGAA